MFWNLLQRAECLLRLLLGDPSQTHVFTRACLDVQLLRVCADVYVEALLVLHVRRCIYQWHTSLLDNGPRVTISTNAGACLKSFPMILHLLSEDQKNSIQRRAVVQATHTRLDLGAN